MDNVEAALLVNPYPTLNSWQWVGQLLKINGSNLTVVMTVRDSRDASSPLLAAGTAYFDDLHVCVTFDSLNPTNGQYQCVFVTLRQLNAHTNYFKLVVTPHLYSFQLLCAMTVKWPCTLNILNSYIYTFATQYMYTYICTKTDVRAVLSYFHAGGGLTETEKILVIVVSVVCGVLLILILFIVCCICCCRCCCGKRCVCVCVCVHMHVHVLVLVCMHVHVSECVYIKCTFDFNTENIMLK